MAAILSIEFEDNFLIDSSKILILKSMLVHPPDRSLRQEVGFTEGTSEGFKPPTF